MTTVTAIAPGMGPVNTGAAIVGKTAPSRDDNAEESITAQGLVSSSLLMSDSSFR